MTHSAPAAGAGTARGPAPAGDQPPLDAAATLAGKNILLIGATGFVGKVMLSMLLTRYPGVGRVFNLVRPGAGATPEDRFFTKVAASPVFDPLREMWGDGFQAFLREKVVPVAGDIGRPLANLTDADFERFAAAGGLDVIINSAGLVTFTPSLESALRINTIGAKNCLEAARRAGARLVHVSTCYVAGRRDGAVWEDEPVVGYFPRKDELRDDDFDAEAEVADCQRLIDEIRARSNDRKHISEFRERAAQSLVDQRRDPDDEATLRLAVARERKLWVHEQLTRLGMDRARHWGWTNTYTYTKSLGEQIILADNEVPLTVVRPAIVESAWRFPFPGWNEGFNTTAPLIYLVMKGQRQIVTGDRTPLDVVPVDMIAAGMISAAVALLAGVHEPVYQLGSSDSNMVTSQRLCELSALAVRRHFQRKADAGENVLQNRIRARLEAYPVTKKRFETTSAPRFKRMADGAIKLLDERLPRWGAPRVTALAERAREELERVSQFTGQVTDLQELFLPFTHDHYIQFRCDNVRALHQRLTPQDRMALPWCPDAIEWRSFWLDTHFEGLVKWVFPVLDDEFGAKPRTIYTYKDLLELFDAATKLNRHRVAMRLLPKEEDAEPIVYTYERVQDMAQQAAAALRQLEVAPGDRVMLMAENRPEWGISYFGILKAGGTAVPVDPQLSLTEVGNLLRASQARVFIVSDRVVERLAEDASAASEEPRAWLTGELEAAGVRVTQVSFDDLLTEPALSPAAVAPPRRADSVASLIFTSGTTGAPKGVMLSHKNFTSMAAKLSSLFHMYRHDVLLSVLPLHHTFEFSAGFLMPLVHGSQITYLDEVGPESLSAALEQGNVTGMVGVPALWQLLHRKISKRFSDYGPLVERAFDGVVDMNRALRERAPYGLNLGKALFFPVHRALGGRLRVLISGGSALSPDVMKAFRGLGFHLFEGYGMTEAAPVITAQRPGDKQVIGSVGRALPGIDVKLHDPDERGVGEIIARGPNVMLGYYENADATRGVLREGWLHTGDLGRFDEDGNLFVVGRKKEMILGPSGENVYPDELEDLYLDSPWVKELSIVGLPADSGETVAALVVPDYSADTALSREAIEERVREHMRSVGAKLPLYKRVRVFHLVDRELERTATRKVRRNLVVDELLKLERAQRPAGEGARKDAGAGKEKDPARESRDRWVRELLARVSQRPRDKVQGDTRLDELGFDSLMLTELAVALENEGVEVADAGELSALETVIDLERYAARNRKAGPRRPGERRVERERTVEEINVPPQVVTLGRRTLRFGQRMLYERALEVEVTGSAYVPPFGGYIVAANHASHLDMGLVKHALGESGESLVALAAKDYFFDDPVRRAYFENFTNLVPMERHGSLRESLRLAGQTLRDGYILLIFPEGTRSETGVMIDFKPSLGYLAMVNHCGILPMYLGGTHSAMPKGSMMIKKRQISAHIGPFQSYERLTAMTAGMSRSESYRKVAVELERMVRKLCPKQHEWALGASGRAVAATEVEAAAEAQP